VSAPTSFIPSRLLTDLGLKGGESAAGVDLRAFLPVMVMADFSKTVSPQFFEPRALWARRVTANIGFFATIVFQAVGEGGAVIEDVMWTLNPLQLAHGVKISRVDGLFGGGVLTEGLRIGGRLPSGRVRSAGTGLSLIDPDQALLPGDSLSGFGSVGGSRHTQYRDLRIFVGPGEFITFQHQLVSNLFESFGLLWREVAPPGSP